MARGNAVGGWVGKGEKNEEIFNSVYNKNKVKEKKNEDILQIQDLYYMLEENT